MDKKQFLYKDSDYLMSLSKFVGKKVVDLVGFVTDPFGGTPLFQISQVIFEDGTSEYIEGEHDVPYIPSTDSIKNMDEETLSKFIEKK